MSAAKTLAIALLAFGCATGGKDGGDIAVDAPKAIDGSPITIDAPGTTVDAHVSTFDAPIVIDAPMVMIDAPSGPFCNGNSECTVSGECCVSLGGPGFCAPGTPIGSACLPD